MTPLIQSKSTTMSASLCDQPQGLICHKRHSRIRRKEKTTTKNEASTTPSTTYSTVDTCHPSEGNCRLWIYAASQLPTPGHKPQEIQPTIGDLYLQPTSRPRRDCAYSLHQYKGMNRFLVLKIYNLLQTSRWFERSYHSAPDLSSYQDWQSRQPKLQHYCLYSASPVDRLPGSAKPTTTLINTRQPNAIPRRYTPANGPIDRNRRTTIIITESCSHPCHPEASDDRIDRVDITKTGRPGITKVYLQPY